MKITIKINGQAVSVEVSYEVYEYLEESKRKTENARQKTYPTKSGGTGMSESLTSTSSLPNAPTYISPHPKKFYAIGKPCTS